MNILMTVNAAWNIWNFRRPVVEALLAEGHRITVLAPPDDSVPDLARTGCSFRPLEMSVKGLNPVQDLKLQRRLTRIFREEAPDVVLSYTIKNNIFGALAARARGIPFLPTITGLGTAFLSGRGLQGLVEGLYRRAFAAAPVVFFQNADDRDLFLARAIVRPGQVRILPGSGVDPVRFPATHRPDHPSEAPVFLMIARVLRDKGVVEFAEAAGIVRARWPGARFRLVGPLGADNRSAIPADTVAGWHRQGLIEHLGELPDVRTFIAAADCVVLPSYREGMPRTLLEAASMARPCIATDVPGCRDAVVDGQTGFLCAVRDGADLARACARFIALSPEARAAMGRRARDRVERDFDQAIVIAAYRAALAALDTGGR